MLETLLQPDDVNERCGFILKDGATVEIANIAEKPAESYEMDPEEALPYVQDGSIAGTWHTHPASDPNLSGEDYLGFLAWPDLEHFVIGKRDGKVIALKFRIEAGLVIACD